MTPGFHFPFTLKDANRLLVGLFLVELGLVLVFALDALIEIPYLMGKLFHLDDEATLPAWFSSVQLFFIGLLFLISVHWPERHRIANPGFLFIVGVGFIFLSMDEAATFHEKISIVLNHAQWVPRFKGNNGSWIPTYFFLAVVFALIGRHTIISMFRAYPRQSGIILLGFAVLIFGAVGLEILAYWYLKNTEFMFWYNLEVAFEEFFEMAGASLILYGTLLCGLRLKP